MQIWSDSVQFRSTPFPPPLPIQRSPQSSAHPAAYAAEEQHGSNAPATSSVAMRTQYRTHEDKRETSMAITTMSIHFLPPRCAADRAVKWIAGR
ncbi:hypothetical protein B0H12DRAFT_808909 [Mycena haematopus]|nr:hypothetical protein B0H12DRAFT_808909 [Mycena haematopus]